ncbi:MAG TPA: NUDIX domain-containing protein [Chryseolinea sp.]|nr:NUDIX domain-containing protein [Chryseolinea sp.]
MNIEEFVREGHLTYMPNVAVDCAIFGFHHNTLKILLLKWKNLDGWSLPGGYMKRTEEAEEAARRLLSERTGLEKIFLQQYYTFTGIDRTKIPGFDLDSFGKSIGVEIESNHWLRQRVVCVGYYALVEYSKVKHPRADSFTEVCSWRSIDDLPPLLFDHKEMIEMAVRTLRLQLNFQPVGLNLLPQKFTMNELQKLYETLLGCPLDRGNFRKKMLGTGILRKTGERPTGKAHKAPHLYSFNKQEYVRSLKSGMKFS